jgi:hypothetical protein
MRRKATHDWWPTVPRGTPKFDFNKEPSATLTLTDPMLKELAQAMAPTACRYFGKDFTKQTSAYQDHFHRIAVECIMEARKLRAQRMQSDRCAAKFDVNLGTTMSACMRDAEHAIAQQYQRHPAAALEEMTDAMIQRLKKLGME